MCLPHPPPPLTCPSPSDVIGVCKSTGDISQITTKTTNRKLNKREIQLVDRSGCVVGGVMTLNPDMPEGHQLRGWFDSVGKTEEVQSISTQRIGGGGEWEELRHMMRV